MPSILGACAAALLMWLPTVSAHAQDSRVPASVPVVAAAGAETVKLDELKTLYDARQWQKLAELCDRQIAATPSWLPPYHYGSVAYANLGERRKALSLIRYVVETAGDYPDYQDARHLFDLLSGALEER